LTLLRNLRGKINPRHSDGIRIPVLEVNVIPGLDSDSNNLRFNWNVTKEDENSMIIKLFFQNPLNVSSSPVSLL
jgi:hypothetical protein